jgi:hypothetical protein
VLADLAELLPYKGDLIQGLEGAQARSTELRQSRKEVTDLLRRYHDFVSLPRSGKAYYPDDRRLRPFPRSASSNRDDGGGSSKAGEQEA